MRRLQDRIHFSELKRIALSPAHYAAACDHPREVNPAAPHLRFGSLVDARLFDVGRVAVWPKARRGKDWDAFEADHPGHLIVTADEDARARECVRSIRANDNAVRVLEGERQKPIEWLLGGRECAGTPDIWCPGRHVTDLKTARTSEPQRLMWAAKRYAYHGQHWFYGDGVKDRGHHEHYIVAVEKDPPFAVTVLHLDATILGAGERLVMSWMTRLRSCEESDFWPAYSQTVVEWVDETDDVDGLVFDTDEEAA